LQLLVVDHHLRVRDVQVVLQLRDSEVAVIRLVPVDEEGWDVVNVKIEWRLDETEVVDLVGVLLGESLLLRLLLLLEHLLELELL
jgi:hypothetical protein